MPTTKCNFKFADQDGQDALTTIYLDGVDSDPTAGDTLTLTSALQGISAAALTGITNVVVDGSIVGVAAENAYDAGDKAVAYGRSASGLDVETSIPCPDETLFEADQETVDLTAGDGATLKAGLEAIWKAADGSAVTVTSIERTRPTRLR
jgi:hypothetical protein